ncbi:MAG: Tyrosine--tRNA ligase [Alphaproteobacteria bacterium MarineAlpha6_Bin4]|nr:MAG: Tyrosine--tRNA ligase [Alphaproteobacteria bacterium MarineAlpha6_Bin4]
MFKPKSALIQELQSRGYIHQCTNIVELDKLANKKKIVAYIGFDCTAESLHVGSLIQLMLIRILQKTGHQVIVLLGDGTSKIGDPSGKDKSRKLLDGIEIKKNSENIKKNIEKFLINKDDVKNVKFLNNSTWLKNINYINFLRIYGKNLSVNKMLTMDSVSDRLKREQPLSFLEFNYMIIQAYDFVELNSRENCEVQFGGSDQWGNITTGVDLIRRINKKEVFGLTTPLITTASGGKMGKTAKGAVWLSEKLLSSNGYWQFWRNVDDKDVTKFLKLFTDLNLSKINKLKNNSSDDINNRKKILADEATNLCHGKNLADTFSIKSNELNKGIELFKIISLNKKVINSNSESRRLIRGGAVKLNGELINDELKLITNKNVKNNKIEISIGKKNYFTIKIV